MTRQVLQILLVSGLILLFTRCAQIVPLSGGTPDTTPPKLVQALPAVNSTHFSAELIVLRFDEFVEVKDLSNQLIVTPRLKTQPDINANGKNIEIKFKKEELMPNTTYRLYFGKAIVDMHAFNPLAGFEYVFSTGSFIDSLEVKGNISDAFNNRPLPDITIGTYFMNEATDSLPYKKQPDYITKSTESGSFLFKNLPYRTFLVYAFPDKNKNGLYDGDAEKIAFLDSALSLSSDTSIKLKLFQEESSKSFIKRTANPYLGFTQILLNKKAKVELRALRPADQPNIVEMFAGKEKDTVSLFYRNITDTLGLVLHNLGSGKKDTLRIVVPRSSAKKRLKSYTLNTIGNKLPLYDKLKLTFLTWMDTTRFDLSKIIFTSKEDSGVAAMPVKGRWTSITAFEIDHPFKEGVSYTMKIDTNAFFDLKQFTNDSIKVQFTPQSKIEFGKLTLKLLFNKKQAYLVQLIDEQDKVVKELPLYFSLSSSNATTIEFTDVPPGNYFAKIIFDDNKNKKWDSGNLILKRQPEKVIINSKQLKILSDWEIEEEILIKE